MEPNPQLLTEKQAAAILQAKPMTLNKWRTRRKGPPYLKISGKVRYTRSDIEAWIASCRIVPSEQMPATRRRRRVNRHA